MDAPGTIFLELLPWSIECLSLRHVDTRFGSASLANISPSRAGKLRELCLENCTFNGTQTFSLSALPPNLRVLDISRTPLAGLSNLATFATQLTRLRLAHIYHPGEPETQAELRAAHCASFNLGALPTGLVELNLCGVTIVGRSPVLNALCKLEITACTVLPSVLTAPALEDFRAGAPRVALLTTLALTPPPTLPLKTLHIESLLYTSSKKGVVQRDVIPVWTGLTCDALILGHFRPTNVIEASIACCAQTVQLHHVFVSRKLFTDLAQLPLTMHIELHSGTIPQAGVRHIRGPASCRLSKRRLQLTGTTVEPPPPRVRRNSVTSVPRALQPLRSVADVLWPSIDTHE